MVFVTDIESFADATKKIFEEAPEEARYGMKFCRETGCVVLNVTDRKTVVSFRTTDATDIRKIEKINAYYLHMCTDREFNEEELIQYEQSKTKPATQNTASKKQTSNHSKKKNKK
eukprot:TRINITY_DN1088_c0_g1_i1.p1 TRINITY_DN1088_c0_g1~~TRINITY_DN1088_c0_g1_i1.p1  ORF type:complete len:115 (+),score=19.41 TRINITY_DN1088_c0_g1_i1:75-419(+)